MSDEKIPQKSELSIDIKRSEGKINLILKFRKVFTYPICLGILINIIITIYFLLNFSSNLKNNKDLTGIIHASEKDRNKPIIENVGNIIYKKFQPSIYSLISFKKYIRQITSEDFLDLKDKSFKNKTKETKLALRDNMIKFIKKYSLNIYEFYINYKPNFDRIKSNLMD